MLCGFGVALLAIGFYEAVFVAPVEATMGQIYRIFYWHVPIATSAETFPYLNMLAATVYLFVRRSKPVLAEKLDALAIASADVTVLYVGLTLATGMLWGRPVWGIWWAWDARLTSVLLLFLLYVSYLLVRRFSTDGNAPVVGAVISIFAGIDVPIVFMSIRWWRTQHPAPVLTGEGSLDKTMWPPLLWNFAAWFVWGCCLIWARYAVVRKEQAAVTADAMEALEA